MDTEMTTADTSTQETASSSVETSGAEISSLDSTQGNSNSTEASSTGTSEVGETPSWSPNFEFTVKDKKHQIDDMFKPAITTKEAEAKLKELYEKSYGLDEVKASRETFKERATTAETEIQTTRQSLQAIGELVRKQDFNTFFDVLKIPKDQILNYAIKELQFEQLPPEQRAQIEQQRRQEQEFNYAQTQNQTLQQQLQDLHVNQAKQELNYEISKPEVSQTAQAFDARVGKPGAFMAEVIRRGQYYEAVHKTSPPASQLIAEVSQFIGMQTTAPQGLSAFQAIPSQGVVNSPKPVIPAFNGSVQKSPVKRTPGSLQDLRDMRKQL